MRGPPGDGDGWQIDAGSIALVPYYVDDGAIVLSAPQRNACRRRELRPDGGSFISDSFSCEGVRVLHWKWTPNIVPLRHITLQVRGGSPGMPNRKVEGMLRVAPTSRHAPNSDKLRIVHERCAFLPRMIIPDLSVRCRGDLRRFNIGFKNWSVPSLPDQDEKTVCERAAAARLAPQRLINPIFTRHEVISWRLRSGPAIACQEQGDGSRSVDAGAGGRRLPHHGSHHP